MIEITNYPLFIILIIIFSMLLDVPFCFICHVIGYRRDFPRSQFLWGLLGIIGVMWVAIIPNDRIE